MQVHATEEYSSAIVVDTQSLERLWAHVDLYAGPAAATVACVDGVERRFENVNDLAAYENPTRSAIKTIEIDGRTRDPDRSVTVTVGRRYGAPATVSVRGEEQDATGVRSRVMDTFVGMRAWYSSVATVDLGLVWTVIFMFVMLILLLMAPSEASHRPGRSLVEAFRALGPVLLAFGSVAVIVVGTAWLRGRYFPLITMAVGQSLRKYQIDEHVRWTVIIGFLVGVAGSAAYALLGAT